MRGYKMRNVTLMTPIVSRVVLFYYTLKSLLTFCFSVIISKA